MPVPGKIKVAHSATFTIAPSVTATWDPNNKGANVTLSGGNLTAAASNFNAVKSTIGRDSGKYYWEIRIQTGSEWMAGFGTPSATLTNWIGSDAFGIGWYRTGGFWVNNTLQATYSAFTTGDILNFALDGDNDKVFIGKNGTWQNGGNPATGVGAVWTLSPATVIFAMFSNGQVPVTDAGTANFGATPFAFAVPSGFGALYG